MTHAALRVLVGLLAATTLLACSLPSPGTAAQELLTASAPDLVIGGRVTKAAHDRYDLLVAPYTGYRDANYSTDHGLGDLMVVVNEYVDEDDASVPRHARITTVVLQLHDTLAVPRLLDRFSDALGAPIVDCFSPGSDETYVRWYWPGQRERGVMLLLSRSPWRRGWRPEGSFGGVAFGARRPDFGPSVAPEDCRSPQARLGAPE